MKTALAYEWAGGLCALALLFNRIWNPLSL
jgi:hypothetical protein